MTESLHPSSFIPQPSSTIPRISARYACVALSLPFKFYSGGSDGLWYAIPPELSELAHPGSRALAPLGKREKTGVIVAVATEAPDISSRLRPIIDVLDSEPVFDSEFLAWTKWVAAYYLTSWGEVLAAALPEGLKPESRSRAVAIYNADYAFQLDRAPRRKEIFEVIAGHADGISVQRLQQQLQRHSLYASLNALERDGLIRIERPLTSRASVRKEAVASLAIEVGSAELSLQLTTIERQAPKQASLLMALIDETRRESPVPVKRLLKRVNSSKATFDALVEKGIVLAGSREILGSTSSARSTESTDDISKLRLTLEQSEAVGQIRIALEEAKARTFLLHGVTGSGKTEVYIALARQVLDVDGGVLILVPEIALTPQLIDRFRRRLSLGDSDEIAVLHSRMSTTDRFAAWRSLASGRIKLAIGARSAVFAPIRNLRLMIVDEEHEATYKQYDKTPRYHARDIAVMRAARLNAVTVLGSATPAIESYYNARQGKYELLHLRERAKQAALPSVRVVDLRTAENRRDFAKARSSVTPELREAIKIRLERKEGIVLLQNRRGFSTYLECIACGEPEMCPNCAVTLTYHRARDQMRCHYCGHTAQKRATCSTCGKESMRLGGMGTERVEDDIRKAFPEARLLRMDLDTTARKGAYRKILTAFANGEADILLGTQMVAKGLDFPRVTLVGVVSADTSLCIPDFRSAERTFQLLTQVSGRAGRSMELAGEVLIQTLQPAHPAIALSVAHDYEAFYNLELADRTSLRYPPLSRLILIEFRGEKEAEVRDRAEKFATLLPERAAYYERIGPAPPAITKLRGEYRWHLIIKNFKSHDANGERIRRLIMGALEQYQKRFASRDVKVIVDVDVQGVA
ncbi:MAG: primosomal protein N' [Bacteroidota bacterium]|nr:primosomal protein N' [Bacteroidota bacterium]MDP4233716.1 primosomal protein N' [Bacteroidota bacterium]MDP4242355.1 primosomal protein N' [Bacteroidota bacterium]MDP4288692.1 primosomal protein N' [Bacteroidota bacterium]